MKIYIASPIGVPNNFKRLNAIQAASILRNIGHSVWCPWEYHIDGAWEISNQDWGKMVFDKDILEIKNSDIVVALSYGRESTAGTSWEIGYAYGIGKQVLVVEMESVKIMSVMISNGCFAVVRGLEGLKMYDLFNMVERRTTTEQM